MSAPQIILVAGLGRCGTSLAMQMLAAGGVDCVGRAPAFEDREHDLLRRSAPDEWLAGAAGKAVKLLDPHRSPPPAGPNYLTFWLFRDYQDQARSQLKMVDAPPTRSNRRRMERMLRADTGRAMVALKTACAAGPPKVFPFDLLLTQPRVMARLMAFHVGRDLDIDRMASVVVPRSPHCLDGFLEHALIAAAEERGTVLA